MVPIDLYSMADTDVCANFASAKESGATVISVCGGDDDEATTIHLEQENIRRASEKTWLLGECDQPYDGATPVAFIRDQDVILVVHLSISKDSINPLGGEILEIGRALEEGRKPTVLMSMSDVALWLQAACLPPVPTAWLTLPAHSYDGNHVKLDWWSSTEWAPPVFNEAPKDYCQASAPPAASAAPLAGSYVMPDRVGRGTRRRSTKTS